MAFYERKELSYDDYVYMQGRKFRDEKERQKIQANEEKRNKLFKGVFTQAKKKMNKGNMLCLGARTGGEIRVARSMGFMPCFGIDLYPIGKEVIKADWHNMPFKDNSFDNVYTNSIDHCYDISILAQEIKRVLRNEGRFFFQLERKKEVPSIEESKEYIQNHENDFIFWENGMDLANAFKEYGFEIVKKWQDRRWDNFVLQVKK